MRSVTRLRRHRERRRTGRSPCPGAWGPMADHFSPARSPFPWPDVCLAAYHVRRASSHLLYVGGMDVGVALQHVTQPAAPATLVLLDGFELRCQAEPVPRAMTAQRLLAFLALHNRPLPRSHVAGTLWLDTTEEHATASLRSVLWRLRRPGHAVI